MAPEVLAKGVAYDSSADWFSFGCMIYKLLKGHSPFRQHKTKDKHEIDKMTMTMVRLPLPLVPVHHWSFPLEHWTPGQYVQWNANPARRFTPAWRGQTTGMHGQTVRPSSLRCSRSTVAFSLAMRRAEEVKEHPFFKDMDWKQVYLLKLTPPLIPPRGEVNAADAFDIGNFDEDDTKGIKVRTVLLFLFFFSSTRSSSVNGNRSRIV